MELYISALTEEIAKIVCEWKYENEYSVYNYGSWEQVVAKNIGISIGVKRNKEFRAIFDEKQNLIGFFRVIENEYENAIEIGLGMNPCYCGKGLGCLFLKTIINYINFEYPNTKISLFVRTFNQRAIKCYKKSGFVITKTFSKNTPTGNGEFYYMEKNEYER